jgi:hypothetical protein
VEGSRKRNGQIGNMMREEEEEWDYENPSALDAAKDCRM